MVDRLRLIREPDELWTRYIERRLKDEGVNLDPGASQGKVIYRQPDLTLGYKTDEIRFQDLTPDVLHGYEVIGKSLALGFGVFAEDLKEVKQYSDFQRQIHEFISLFNASEEDRDVFLMFHLWKEKATLEALESDRVHLRVDYIEGIAYPAQEIVDEVLDVFLADYRSRNPRNAAE